MLDQSPSQVARTAAPDPDLRADLRERLPRLIRWLQQIDLSDA